MLGLIGIRVFDPPTKRVYRHFWRGVVRIVAAGAVVSTVSAAFSSAAKAQSEIDPNVAHATLGKLLAKIKSGHVAPQDFECEQMCSDAYNDCLMQGNPTACYLQEEKCMGRCQ